MFSARQFNLHIENVGEFHINWPSKLKIEVPKWHMRGILISNSEILQVL